MVGDGSYLMMAQEIVTSVQEGYKLIIVLLDSQRLSRASAACRDRSARAASARSIAIAIERRALTGSPLPVDLAANAESLGAIVHRATDRAVARGGAVSRARRRSHDA